MSICKDFWFGFSKPFRDLAGALFTYLIITTYPAVLNISSTTPLNPDNTKWVILGLFICISAIDDLLSEVIANIRKGYDDPIDGTIRFMGICLGTVILFVFLTPIYVMMGWEITDLIFSVVIVSFCMGLGMLLRILFSPTMRW
jgi:hypothetical protein